MPKCSALTINAPLPPLAALILLGDPNQAPMTLRATNLVSSFGTQCQLLTAAASISTILPLLSSSLSSVTLGRALLRELSKDKRFGGKDKPAGK